MNILGSGGVWVGLFSHIDSVSRASLELLLKLKGIGIKEQGKEYFVDESTFKTIDKLMKNRELRVGGNAGNAAYFLGSLGIECNLSAPVRPKELMAFFQDLPVFFWGVRRKRAKMAIKDDPPYEHIVLELFPPLSSFKRTIISWDPMTMGGQLDMGFWEKMKSGIFFLSGLHLIRERERVEDVVERLKKKNVKMYLEVGEPTGTMKYAVDRLIEEGLVDHMGMNEREAMAVFGAEPDDVGAMMKELSCGVTIHTTDFVASTNTKMLRPLIDAVEAWAMGDLQYYRQTITMPLRRTPDGTTPTRNLPFLEKLTGLGDATGALDAIRVFDPKKMKKLVGALPFYGTNEFPSRF